MKLEVLIAVHCGIIVLLAVLGVLFSLGKGEKLVAGFNAASPEGKEPYDTHALLRFLGIILLLMAGSFCVILVSDFNGSVELLLTGLGLFAAVLAAAVLGLKFSRRLRK